MKLSLLELVQDILNDTDGDPVNSIDDTQESVQIAQIVKSTYYALLSRRNWPHTARGVSLVPSTDAARPTHMRLNTEIQELISINYDSRKAGSTRKDFQKISWRDPDDFLRATNRENSDDASVLTVIDHSGIELLIRNDRAPKYFTSFDDDYLVFDAYDSSVDDTLQDSKTQARAYVIPDWAHTDSFIPDLPSEAFTGLLEEAKSRAALKLNQDADQKAEQESVRQQRWLSRKAWRAQGGISYPNYGRK